MYVLIFFFLILFKENFRPNFNLILHFRQGPNYFDKFGFASLTVWNMKTWKAVVCSYLCHFFMC